MSHPEEEPMKLRPVFVRSSTSHLVSLALLALSGCGGGRAYDAVTVAADERSLLAQGAVPQPTCSGAPDAGPRAPWRHPLSSPFVVIGAQQHRGLDLITDAAGPTQVIAGEIHYGLFDKALEDERIDVF